MSTITYNQGNKSRGQLVEVHLADLHFGAMNPKVQYDILMEQFYTPVSNHFVHLLIILQCFRQYYLVSQNTYPLPQKYFLIYHHRVHSC